MQTHFIEVTNNDMNWGKFLLFRFDNEWQYKSAFTGISLLREVGWNRDNIVVLDLQTGEAARFVPGGLVSADMKRHAIWVCPMYQPFLEWLYEQDVSDLSKLPASLNLPNAEFAMAGYRRKRRFQCERCGGTGKQEAGLYNYETKKYDAVAGPCDDCEDGFLGEVPDE